jgi:hypothetical protein
MVGLKARDVGAMMSGWIAPLALTDPPRNVSSLVKSLDY